MSSMSVFGRRRFLQTTAIWAATPWILAGQAVRRVRGANDKLGLAFIGVGKQSGGLLQSFIRGPDVQVVAVCDVDGTRRVHYQKSAESYYAAKTDSGAFTGIQAVSDFREILSRKDVDAVVIATPDHWHAVISIAAAKAGKDIYCEKPLCQSVVEADAMVRAVRANNVVFQTGSQQRSSAEFQTACELVRNGRIGKVERVEVAVGGPGVPCGLPEEAMEPGLDWDMWLGPAPLRPYHSELSPRGVHNHYPNWRKYWEYGGGMVTDWGAHHFDIAQWGLGMDGSGPVEVFPAPGDEPTRATHGVRFRYGTGVEVTHRAQDNGVWFHGTDGMIFVTRGRFEFKLGDKTIAESPRDLGRVREEYLSGDGIVRLYESRDHHGDWLKCIRNRERPICDVEVGAGSVKVCHLVNMAYKHGERFFWNPGASRFEGGTGKADWLDVPRRGPWTV